MKQRFFTGLGTLVCVIACVFALAACNNGQTPTVEVEGIKLNKTELTLEVGGEETLTATVTPDNATNKAVGWSSDNAAVVTVTDGKVKAVAAGKATVTAKSGGKSATCSVTVNEPRPTTEVTAAQWEKILGSTRNFTASQTMEVNDEKMSAVVKVDGTTRSLSVDGVEQIFVKEDDKYYGFYLSGDEKWERVTLDEEKYGMSERISQIVAAFKDDYDAFTYADGKYTAADLDKTEAMNAVIASAEITFKNDALVGLRLHAAEYNQNVEVTDIGTTKITVPTEYTDKTPTAGR